MWCCVVWKQISYNPQAEQHWTFTSLQLMMLSLGPLASAGDCAQVLEYVGLSKLVQH